MLEVFPLRWKLSVGGRAIDASGGGAASRGDDGSLKSS
jgi:hypothetical protein